MFESEFSELKNEQNLKLSEPEFTELENEQNVKWWMEKAL
jgi:hypothetical protein